MIHLFSQLFHSPIVYACINPILYTGTNLYMAHPMRRHKPIHDSSYTQTQVHTWLIQYKKGETPHTRYLSSLKVIASYHILFLLTSRPINLIRILIFRPIETSVLYVIFHFHQCFWKKSWHTHRTTGGSGGSGSLSCRTRDRFRHIW